MRHDRRYADNNILVITVGYAIIKPSQSLGEQNTSILAKWRSMYAQS